ncbi:DUF423 domain-containing protein [Petrachloros mirabilis]|jgi:uncharacterized membrane protein YgdD (TMEM256/DUF423 family)
MIPCAKRFLLLGTILAGSAVAAGAFGAHSLKGVLDPAMLTVFETAVRYHMNHALGLCIVSLTMERYPDQRLAAVGWLFLTGIILFSGSLYTLSLSGIRWFGVLTPLGGSAWIGGWGLFAWKLWNARQGTE